MILHDLYFACTYFTFSDLEGGSLSSTDNDSSFPGLDFIPCIPHVTKVRIFFPQTSIGVEKLSLMCPNMTELKLDGTMHENFTIIAPIIWSNMRKLKSLTMGILVNGARNEAFDIYSAITGFSQESCKKINGIIWKNKNRLTLDELQKFERQNPSILDLQGT